MDNKRVFSFALLLAGALSPLAVFGSMGFAIILCGALLSYFYTTENISYVFTGCGGIFVFVLVVLNFNFLIAAITALQVFLLALILKRGFLNRISFSKVIIKGSMVYLFANAASIMFFAKQAGVTPVDMLFRLPLNQAIEAFSGTGGAGDKYVEMLTAHGESLIENFELLSPSYLMLTAALSTYVTFAIARGATERKEGRLLHLPYFYELRLPKGVTAVFLVMFVFTILFSGLSAIMLNIITIILAVLTVCGISVLDYYLKKRGFHGVLRFLVYAGIFIFSVFSRLGSYLAGILFATGVLDSFAGLRK